MKIETATAARPMSANANAINHPYSYAIKFANRLNNRVAAGSVAPSSISVKIRSNCGITNVITHNKIKSVKAISITG